MKGETKNVGVKKKRCTSCRKVHLSTVQTCTCGGFLEEFIDDVAYAASEVFSEGDEGQCGCDDGGCECDGGCD